MRRSGIEGEGVAWAIGAFVASLLIGLLVEPFRATIGLENVVILYLLVVVAAAGVGGRAAGIVAAVSAALAYNFFFTTPYETLQIDSWGQVTTVMLLFVAGLLASLGGRAGRRAKAEAREEAAALRMLTAVNLAVARGDRDADQVAAEHLRELLGARAVHVVRAHPGGERVVAWAGEALEPDPGSLPRLDEEGRIPAGHRRSVGGTLVLPAQGAVVALVHSGRRVGSLVVVPAANRPVLRSTRMAIAATAHALAMAR